MMAEQIPDCCKAGIRTITRELSMPSGIDEVAAWTTVAMALSAEAYLAEQPDAGVRELTGELAEAWHFVDGVDGFNDRPMFMWGPAAGRTPEEHRSYPTADGLTTERLALAIATCATRNCDRFESCLKVANRRGWTHAETPAKLLVKKEK